MQTVLDFCSAFCFAAGCFFRGRFTGQTGVGECRFTLVPVTEGNLLGPSAGIIGREQSYTAAASDEETAIALKMKPAGARSFVGR